MSSPTPARVPQLNAAAGYFGRGYQIPVTVDYDLIGETYDATALDYDAANEIIGVRSDNAVPESGALALEVTAFAIHTGSDELFVVPTPLTVTATFNPVADPGQTEANAVFAADFSAPLVLPDGYQQGQPGEIGRELSIIGVAGRDDAAGFAVSAPGGVVRLGYTADGENSINAGLYTVTMAMTQTDLLGTVRLRLPANIARKELIPGNYELSGGQSAREPALIQVAPALGSGSGLNLSEQIYFVTLEAAAEGAVLQLPDPTPAGFGITLADDELSAKFYLADQLSANQELEETALLTVFRTANYVPLEQAVVLTVRALPARNVQPVSDTAPYAAQDIFDFAETGTPYANATFTRVDDDSSAELQINSDGVVANAAQIAEAGTYTLVALATDPNEFLGAARVELQVDLAQAGQLEQNQVISIGVVDQTRPVAPDYTGSVAYWAPAADVALALPASAPSGFAFADDNIGTDGVGFSLLLESGLDGGNSALAEFAATGSQSGATDRAVDLRVQVTAIAVPDQAVLLTPENAFADHQINLPSGFNNPQTLQIVGVDGGQADQFAILQADRLLTPAAGNAPTFGSYTVTVAAEYAESVLLGTLFIPITATLQESLAADAVVPVRTFAGSAVQDFVGPAVSVSVAAGFALTNAVFETDELDFTDDYWVVMVAANNFDNAATDSPLELTLAADAICTDPARACAPLQISITATISPLAAPDQGQGIAANYRETVPDHNLIFPSDFPGGYGRVEIIGAEKIVDHGDAEANFFSVGGGGINVGVNGDENGFFIRDFTALELHSHYFPVGNRDLNCGDEERSAGLELAAFELSQNEVAFGHVCLDDSGTAGRKCLQAFGPYDPAQVINVAGDGGGLGDIPADTNVRVCSEDLNNFPPCLTGDGSLDASGNPFDFNNPCPELEYPPAVRKPPYPNAGTYRLTVEAEHVGFLGDLLLVVPAQINQIPLDQPEYQLSGGLNPATVLVAPAYGPNLPVYAASISGENARIENPAALPNSFLADYSADNRQVTISRAAAIPAGTDVAANLAFQIVPAGPLAVNYTPRQQILNLPVRGLSVPDQGAGISADYRQTPPTYDLTFPDETGLRLAASYDSIAISGVEKIQTRGTSDTGETEGFFALNAASDGIDVVSTPGGFTAAELLEHYFPAANRGVKCGARNSDSFRTPMLQNEVEVGHICVDEGGDSGAGADVVCFIGTEGYDPSQAAVGGQSVPVPANSPLSCPENLENHPAHVSYLTPPCVSGGELDNSQNPFVFKPDFSGPGCSAADYQAALAGKSGGSLANAGTYRITVEATHSGFRGELLLPVGAVINPIALSGPDFELSGGLAPATVLVAPGYGPNQPIYAASIAAAEAQIRNPSALPDSFAAAYSNGGREVEISRTAAVAAGSEISADLPFEVFPTPNSALAVNFTELAQVLTLPVRGLGSSLAEANLGEAQAVSGAPVYQFSEVAYQGGDYDGAAFSEAEDSDDFDVSATGDVSLARNLSPGNYLFTVAAAGGDVFRGTARLTLSVNVRVGQIAVDPDDVIAEADRNILAVVVPSHTGNIHEFPATVPFSGGGNYELEYGAVSDATDRLRLLAGGGVVALPDGQTYQQALDAAAGAPSIELTAEISCPSLAGCLNNQVSLTVRTEPLPVAPVVTISRRARVDGIVAGTVLFRLREDSQDSFDFSTDYGAATFGKESGADELTVSAEGEVSLVVEESGLTPGEAYQIVVAAESGGFLGTALLTVSLDFLEAPEGVAFGDEFVYILGDTFIVRQVAENPGAANPAARDIQFEYHGVWRGLHWARGELWTGSVDSATGIETGNANPVDVFTDWYQENACSAGADQGWRAPGVIELVGGALGGAASRVVEFTRDGNTHSALRPLTRLRGNVDPRSLPTVALTVRAHSAGHALDAPGALPSDADYLADVYSNRNGAEDNPALVVAEPPSTVPDGGSRGDVQLFQPGAGKTTGRIVCVRPADPDNYDAPPPLLAAGWNQADLAAVELTVAGQILPVAATAVALAPRPRPFDNDRLPTVNADLTHERFDDDAANFAVRAVKIPGNAGGYTLAVEALAPATDLSNGEYVLEIGFAPEFGVAQIPGNVHLDGDGNPISPEQGSATDPTHLPLKITVDWRQPEEPFTFNSVEITAPHDAADAADGVASTAPGDFGNDANYVMKYAGQFRGLRVMYSTSSSSYNPWNFCAIADGDEANSTWRRPNLSEAAGIFSSRSQVNVTIDAGLNIPGATETTEFSIPLAGGSPGLPRVSMPLLSYYDGTTEYLQVGLGYDEDNSRPAADDADTLRLRSHTNSGGGSVVNMVCVQPVDPATYEAPAQLAAVRLESGDDEITVAQTVPAAFAGAAAFTVTASAWNYLRYVVDNFQGTNQPVTLTDEAVRAWLPAASQANFDLVVAEVNSGEEGVQEIVLQTRSGFAAQAVAQILFAPALGQTVSLNVTVPYNDGTAPDRTITLVQPTNNGGALAATDEDGAAVNSGGTVPHGTRVTFTATPTDENWYVSSWTGVACPDTTVQGDTTSGGAASVCPVAAGADLNVEAVFARVPMWEIVFGYETGSGGFAPEAFGLGSATGVRDEEANPPAVRATLTVAQNASVFLSYEGDSLGTPPLPESVTIDPDGSVQCAFAIDTGGSVDIAECSFAVPANHVTVVANFPAEIVLRAVNYSKLPGGHANNGGTLVETDGRASGFEVANGATVTFTATPNDGWTVTWNDASGCDDNDRTCEVAVDGADAEVVAVFGTGDDATMNEYFPPDGRKRHCSESNEMEQTGKVTGGYECESPVCVQFASAYDPAAESITNGNGDNLHDASKNPPAIPALCSELFPACVSPQEQVESGNPFSGCAVPAATREVSYSKLPGGHENNGGVVTVIGQQRDAPFDVAPDATVTFTATPNAGWTVTWNDESGCDDNDRTCEVIVSENVNVTAIFGTGSDANLNIYFPSDGRTRHCASGAGLSHTGVVAGYECLSPRCFEMASAYNPAAPKFLDEDGLNYHLLTNDSRPIPALCSEAYPPCTGDQIKPGGNPFATCEDPPPPVGEVDECATNHGGCTVVTHTCNDTDKTQTGGTTSGGVVCTPFTLAWGNVELDPVPSGNGTGVATAIPASETILEVEVPLNLSYWGRRRGLHIVYHPSGVSSPAFPATYDPEDFCAVGAAQGWRPPTLGEIAGILNVETGTSFPGINRLNVSPAGTPSTGDNTVIATGFQVDIAPINSGERTDTPVPPNTLVGWNTRLADGTYLAARRHGQGIRVPNIGNRVVLCVLPVPGDYVELPLLGAVRFETADAIVDASGYAAKGNANPALYTVQASPPGSSAVPFLTVTARLWRHLDSPEAIRGAPVVSQSIGVAGISWTSEAIADGPGTRIVISGARPVADSDLLLRAKPDLGVPSLLRVQIAGGAAPVLRQISFSGTPTGGGAVSAADTGGTRILNNGNVQTGTEVVFTATPTNGWHVSDWNNPACTDEDADGSEGTVVRRCTLTANAPLDVRAIFTRNPIVQRQIRFSADPSSGGAVRAETVGGDTVNNNESVANGTEVAFIATPVSGWHVSGWNNTDCADIGNPNDGDRVVRRCTLPANSDLNIVATFTQNRQVSFSEVPTNKSGGTVSAASGGANVADDANVAHGATVTFTATPAAGWYVSGWTSGGTAACANRLGGDADTAAKTCPLEAGAPLNVVATFTEATAPESQFTEDFTNIGDDSIVQVSGRTFYMKYLGIRRGVHGAVWIGETLNQAGVGNPIFNNYDANSNSSAWAANSNFGSRVCEAGGWRAPTLGEIFGWRAGDSNDGPIPITRIGASGADPNLSPAGLVPVSNAASAAAFQVPLTPDAPGDANAIDRPNANDNATGWTELYSRDGGGRGVAVNFRGGDARMGGVGSNRTILCVNSTGGYDPLPSLAAIRFETGGAIVEEAQVIGRANTDDAEHAHNVVLAADLQPGQPFLTVTAVAWKHKTGPEKVADAPAVARAGGLNWMSFATAPVAGGGGTEIIFTADSIPTANGVGRMRATPSLGIPAQLRLNVTAPPRIHRIAVSYLPADAAPSAFAVRVGSGEFQSPAGGSNEIVLNVPESSTTPILLSVVGSGGRIVESVRAEAGGTFDYCNNSFGATTDWAGGAETCALLPPTAPYNVIVQFTAPGGGAAPRNIAFSASPANGGAVVVTAGASEVLNNGSVADGTELTFTADPAAGWHVSGWRSGGTAVCTGQVGDPNDGGQDRTCPLTANSNLDVVATFTQNRRVEFSTSPASGSGAVAAAVGAANVASGTNVADGAEVAFTATPVAGWYVSGWSSGGTAVCTDRVGSSSDTASTPRTCPLTAGAPLVVVATFTEAPAVSASQFTRDFVDATGVQVGTTSSDVVVGGETFVMTYRGIRRGIRGALSGGALPGGTDDYARLVCEAGGWRSPTVGEIIGWRTDGNGPFPVGVIGGNSNLVEHAPAGVAPGSPNVALTPLNQGDNVSFVNRVELDSRDANGRNPATHYRSDQIVHFGTNTTGRHILCVDPVDPATYAPLPTLAAIRFETGGEIVDEANLLGRANGNDANHPLRVSLKAALRTSNGGPFLTITAVAWKHKTAPHAVVPDAPVISESTPFPSWVSLAASPVDGGGGTEIIFSANSADSLPTASSSAVRVRATPSLGIPGQLILNVIPPPEAPSATRDLEFRVIGRGADRWEILHGGRSAALTRAQVNTEGTTASLEDIAAGGLVTLRVTPAATDGVSQVQTDTAGVDCSAMLGALASPAECVFTMPSTEDVAITANIDLFNQVVFSFTPTDAAPESFAARWEGVTAFQTPAPSAPSVLTVRVARRGPGGSGTGSFVLTLAAPADGGVESVAISGHPICGNLVANDGGECTQAVPSALNIDIVFSVADSGGGGGGAVQRDDFTAANLLANCAANGGTFVTAGDLGGPNNDEDSNAGSVACYFGTADKSCFVAPNGLPSGETQLYYFGSGSLSTTPIDSCETVYPKCTDGQGLSEPTNPFSDCEAPAAPLTPRPDFTAALLQSDCAANSGTLVSAGDLGGPNNDEDSNAGSVACYFGTADKSCFVAPNGLPSGETQLYYFGSGSLPTTPIDSCETVYAACPEGEGLETPTNPFSDCTGGDDGNGGGTTPPPVLRFTAANLEGICTESGVGGAFWAASNTFAPTGGSAVAGVVGCAFGATAPTAAGLYAHYFPADNRLSNCDALSAGEQRAVGVVAPGTSSQGAPIVGYVCNSVGVSDVCYQRLDNGTGLNGFRTSNLGFTFPATYHATPATPTGVPKCSDLHPPCLDSSGALDGSKNPFTENCDPVFSNAQSCYVDPAGTATGALRLSAGGYAYTFAGPCETAYPACVSPMRNSVENNPLSPCVTPPPPPPPPKVSFSVIPADGSGGTLAAAVGGTAITSGATVAESDSVVFTATPTPGGLWFTDRWLGACAGRNVLFPCSAAAPATGTLAAGVAFAQARGQLLGSPTGNGSVEHRSVDEDGNLESGSTRTLANVDTFTLPAAPRQVRLRLFASGGNPVTVGMVINNGATLSLSGDRTEAYFSDSGRMVSVARGDIFFDRHTAETGWVTSFVDAQGQTIQPKGTAMRMRAHQTNGFTEFALLEGRVAVVNPAANVPAEIRCDDQAARAKGGGFATECFGDGTVLPPATGTIVVLVGGQRTELTPASQPLEIPLAGGAEIQYDGETGDEATIQIRADRSRPASELKLPPAVSVSLTNDPQAPPSTTKPEVEVLPGSPANAVLVDEDGTETEFESPDAPEPEPMGRFTAAELLRAFLPGRESESEMQIRRLRRLQFKRASKQDSRRKCGRIRLP